MEKLVERFDNILDESIPNWDIIDWEKHNRLCAEEAKKLALAFANYQENSQYDEDKCMPQEALFNKFLDEYYA